VMLGYLLAGTDEAPGDKVFIGDKCFKPYRGMGSRSALESGSARYGSFKKVPEGAEGLVECKGPARRVVDYIVGGLKQGMGYVGARSISQLKLRAEFVLVSPSTHREGGPRGLVEAKGPWEQLSSK